ncbi:MAG TPA: response regulator [Pseudomonadota bacterium]|nr:response regulator [Pseudomonadota bacterium]
MATTAQPPNAADLALHSRILTNLGEGVQLTRASDQRILFANPAFERMFGYGPGELVGQPVEVLNSAEVSDPSETAQQIIAALKQSGCWSGEIVNRRKDGSNFVCHATVTESHHPQHGIVWISIHHDISQRVQIERERAALQRKLMEAQRLESLGLLAGGIAHDINNDLLLILGSASLLRSDAHDDPGQAEALRQIQIGAYHIRDLVQQVLAFAGKGRFVSQPIVMGELIRDLEPLLQASIGMGVRLVCDLGPGLPAIDGDPGQLRQLLLNLVINSSEALEGAPGVIRISVGPYQPGDSLRLPAHAQAGLVIEIADDGPGIPGHLLSRIFEPFFSTKATGRGLGLAAVLGIVRSHQGAILAHAPPQGGALFRIALPAGKLAPAAPPQPPPQPKPTGRSVLVVDDEPGVRHVLKLFLQRSGYSVLLAEGGEQALQLISQPAQGIAAVLLDLTMPGRSGDEVLGDIRRVAPGLPVILMSGYNAKAALSPEVIAELAGLLTKPFEKSDLLQLLHTVLPPPVPATS